MAINDFPPLGYGTVGGLMGNIWAAPPYTYDTQQAIFERAMAQQRAGMQQALQEQQLGMRQGLLAGGMQGIGPNLAQRALEAMDAATEETRPQQPIPWRRIWDFTWRAAASIAAAIYYGYHQGWFTWII